MALFPFLELANTLRLADLFPFRQRPIGHFCPSQLLQLEAGSRCGNESLRARLLLETVAPARAAFGVLLVFHERARLTKNRYNLQIER